MDILLPRVTRRSVLTWGGACTLGLTFSPALGAPARASTAERLVVAGSASSFPTFSEDFRQRYVNALPNAVEVVSPISLGGGTVRVNFDAGMLALSDKVAQLVADGVVTSTPIAVDGGTATVDIPGQVSANRIVVMLPFFSTVGYPAENIGASAAPTAHVMIQEQVAHADFPLDLPNTEGVAWGGEIDVAWRRQSAGGDTDYFVPALLSLTSVGPGPVPANTQILVRTDSVLTGETRPVTAPTAEPEPGNPMPEPDLSAGTPAITTTTAQGDGARYTGIMLNDPLEAGTTFTTALSGSSVTTRVRVKAVTFAQVTVEPPENSRNMQRVTGSETVTSLAPGGLPLATDMLMGSI